jgi:hypothetical protein
MCIMLSITIYGTLAQVGNEKKRTGTSANDENGSRPSDIRKFSGTTFSIRTQWMPTTVSACTLLLCWRHGRPKGGLVVSSKFSRRWQRSILRWLCAPPGARAYGHYGLPKQFATALINNTYLLQHSASEARRTSLRGRFTVHDVITIPPQKFF